MSGREWKPGDVAVIRVPKKSQPKFAAHEQGSSDLCAVRTTSGGWAALEDVDYFWGAEYCFHEVEPRPLVVIDPEDREQVERLMSLLANSLNWGPHNLQRDTYCEPLQAALREFANPKHPKPDEPMNPAATVIDTDGVVWVSWRQKPGELGYHNQPWQALIFDQEEDDFRDWNEVDAVRVLSEGVQP